jgi:cytochrome P450
LLIAGSETTATLLSAALYLLCMNPDALEKVQNEVRSAFASNEEINLNSVHKLNYMLAVLNETGRCFPPVPNALTRIVPEGGAVILGLPVPEKVS